MGEETDFEADDKGRTGCCMSEMGLCWKILHNDPT